MLRLAQVAASLQDISIVKKVIGELFQRRRFPLLAFPLLEEKSSRKMLCREDESEWHGYFDYLPVPDDVEAKIPQKVYLLLLLIQNSN